MTGRLRICLISCGQHRTAQKLISVDGVTLNMSSWALRLGITVSTLSQRISRYGVEQAIAMGRVQVKRSMSLAERISANTIPVSETGCLLWLGAECDNGYGQITVDRVKHYVHRAAWEIANGRPVPAGLSVLHSCDVPLCCRPDHLRVGTASDNYADMVSRKRERHPKGEATGRAKLTEAAVLEAIRLRGEGFLVREIAARLLVSSGAINGVLRGKNWSHLTGRTTR